MLTAGLLAVARARVVAALSLQASLYWSGVSGCSIRRIASSVLRQGMLVGKGKGCNHVCMACSSEE